MEQKEEDQKPKRPPRPEEEPQRTEQAQEEEKKEDQGPKRPKLPPGAVAMGGVPIAFGMSPDKLKNLKQNLGNKQNSPDKPKVGPTNPSTPEVSHFDAKVELSH